MIKDNLKIHIIGGTGQMGTWLKSFLESQGMVVSVSGSHGGKEAEIEEVDIVFIAVPISKAKDVIKETAKIVKKDTLLADLSSVQSEVANVLKETQLPAVGIHLLFGPTVSSLNNQRIIFSVIRNNPKIKILQKLFENNGGLILLMKPEEHDKQMALVQNLSHFINLGLVHSLIKNKVDLGGRISTPVFLSQLSTINRVIAQDPNLLTEIQLGNQYGLNMIKEYLDFQNKLVGLITDKNSQKLKEEIGKLHNFIESSKNITDSKKAIPLKNGKVKRVKGKVGFLGPNGTFSNQAAFKIAAAGQLVPSETIFHIFQSVVNGLVDFGVVPAENSTEGTIRETLDYLIDLDLKTNGSIELPIHQNLLSKEKDLSKIKRVVSHPQALAQCRNWLHQHLPDVNLESAKSTISGVEEAKKTSGVALICPSLAARLYGLNILAKEIEDSRSNITKFYIVSKNIKNINGSKRTLLFLTVFNRVGILRDILNVFANLGINLSKLESRPSREKIWDYHFFIEVDVLMNDEKLIESLNILKQYCPVIKVLGGV